jgi:hypothetical protein
MSVNKDEVTAITMLTELEAIVTGLEGKMDELYMRPRMPYSQNGFVGDRLELDGNLQPEWVA